ncbi:GNAT family N-acetyltransferase [Microbacterium oleivorans]|uniref:GCN5-related N-acetyltransferase n=1 Tax=Microbacterium oleivorans TaxID=273677 RepID=A0A031FVB3_9MICO|nr:GNAT family N-acetyltransferase [Microbacterium oleivorans]EZP28197.1 GCN5-related N-acetyltransferase [Microbacterium oleivorans]
MITVTPARATDLASASVILAEAFAHDPVMSAIVPGSHRRHERLTELFHGLLASGPYATGTVDLARDADGTLLGVAAWEGPHAERGAFGRQTGELPRFARALGWLGMPRALALLSRLARHRPRAPHWYLAEIGVSAAARGKGVGKALLAAQLDTLDTTRQTAYLESSTPDNRRLYRRFGFEELSPIDGVPGATPVAMLRLPAAR